MKYTSDMFGSDAVTSREVSLMTIHAAWDEAAQNVSSDLQGLVNELQDANRAFGEAFAARRDTGFSDHQAKVLLDLGFDYRLPVTRALLGYIERSVSALSLVPQLFATAAGLRAEAHLLLHHWPAYSQALEASRREEP